jgi:PST family polysaccharide transporter
MSRQAEINAQMLSTEHLTNNLGQQAARGGIIAVGAQPLRMIVQFVTTALLARLLAPEDFGLLAMATAVTGFIGIFSNLGLGSATVQQAEIDQDTVSGLFYINLGVGLLLAPIACLLAPLAAMFFKDPRVTGLVVALAFTLPLAAAGAQHTGLMVRTMRWMTIQWTSLAGQVLGGVVGVGLAWKTELDYWALVAAAWTTNLVIVVLIWIACPWRPSAVKNWDGVRKALNFGLNLTGFSVVNFFNRQLDNIIIGWRSGAMELGFYTRAYQVMLLPINLFSGPLSSAVEPSLSRLQDDPVRWRRAFLDALGLIAFLGSGMAAVMIACASALIAVLYGPGWEKAGVIFQWLAVSMIAGTPMNATGWIYISLGRTRRMLAWSLIFTPVVAAAFLLAMGHGPVGIAIAYAVVMNLAIVPAFAFATHGSPVRLRDTMKVILPMAACGVAAALAGVWTPVPHPSPLIGLVFSSTIAGTIYVALAGALIWRLDVYRDVRVRVVDLSRGLFDSARARLAARRAG